MRGGEVIEDVVDIDAGVAVKFAFGSCAARVVEVGDEGTPEGDRFLYLGVSQA